MFINNKKMAIEMTKKFAAAARKFGTQEYKDLQEVRKDYPTYKVVIVTRTTTVKKDNFKGLTYEYIKKWFLAQYPDVAKFGTDAADQKESKESKSQNVVPFTTAKTAEEAEGTESQKGA